MKVLHIIDNLGMGGAEVWLMALLRHWRMQGGGPQIDILATSGRAGVFDDEARQLGVRITYLRFGRSRLPAFARSLRRILREGRYDALHDHQDYASGFHFALGGVLPQVRITHVHMHDPPYRFVMSRGRQLQLRLTGQLGRALIARYATHIAGTSRRALAKHGFDSRVFDHIPKMALYCGFDPARFAGNVQEVRDDVRAEFGWSPAARIALFAGRIDISPDLDHPLNHKNSAFAVAVAITACRCDPGLHFLFAGAPTDATPVLQRRITEAGFSRRIKLLGLRHDVPRLMLGSNALLFPSRAEGLGMVSVEAQAAGVPVLASTGVPRECVVVPELVTFLDIGAGIDVWARSLAELALRPHRPDANAQVARSEFAIAYSAEVLTTLYSGGRAG